MCHHNWQLAVLPYCLIVVFVLVLVLVLLPCLPGHCLAVDKTCNGASHNLKAQIGAFHAASKRKYLSGLNTIVDTAREMEREEDISLSLRLYLCVGVSHLQLEDHVEHALGTVGLQQLDNVRMLQHVTYCGFAFQI